MKILFLFLFVVNLSFGQDVKLKNGIIELGEIYHAEQFGFPPEIEKKLDEISSPALLLSKKFFLTIGKEKANLGTKEFLIKPDSLTLKYIYVARGINYKLFNKPPRETTVVFDSLFYEHTDYNVLLSCYYETIFSQLLNNGQGFNMADVDFRLDEYNLSEGEKAIFFLNAMERLGALIWGYMTIPNPPNYKKALDYVNRYPQFNGRQYYLYEAFNFKDFDIRIDKARPTESFKKYYLTKYMNILLYHMICLSQPGSDRDKRQEVIEKSIIKNEAYWQYYNQPEVLKQIFQK